MTNHGCLSPVAALAAVIVHQADGTVLDVGLSLVALIEVVFVGWVRVESIRLASAEARSSTAAATTAAATTAATTAGQRLLGWLDWREGVRTSTAG